MKSKIGFYLDEIMFYKCKNCNASYSDLSKEEKQKISEMLQQGLSADQIMNELYKLNKNLSESEQIDMLKSQLGDKARSELEKMLQEGYSLSEEIS